MSDSCRDARGADSLHAVLFVDDEPRVLQALERMLHPLRSEWRMEFVTSGEQALEALERSSFDVVVTDLRMPGMTGLQLMQTVLQRHPRVVRILLSGCAERDTLLQVAQLAHQMLSKPCDSVVLRERLVQAIRLRRFTQSQALQAIASSVPSLRAVPSLYLQVMAELQAPSPSAARVAELVSTDPAMTAKVLQLINSAFFGLRGYVSDSARAVQLLGLETVQALVLSMQVFSRFSARGPSDPPAIWRHALRTARTAEHVARAIGLTAAETRDAFTAGLLHDVGKLVMAEAVPDYEKVVRSAAKTDDLVEAERATYGASHAEVGAYLFGLWGLPYGVVEAVAWHHRPAESGIRERSPLTAVHAADAIDHEIHEDVQAHPRLDDNYLASLGLADEYAGWRRKALDHAFTDSAA